MISRFVGSSKDFSHDPGPRLAGGRGAERGERGMSFSAEELAALAAQFVPPVGEGHY